MTAVLDDARSQSITSTEDDALLWPELHPAALHGTAGDFVRTVAPESESAPVALLSQMLVMFGAAVGLNPAMVTESTTHRTRLFMVLLGRTAGGRKGTSLEHVRRIFRIADQDWAGDAEIRGLASGEAMIKRLAERSGRSEGLRGAVIVESEFSRILAVAAREGSILSQDVRELWDRDCLDHNTLKNPIKAEGVHCGIISHCTIDEIKATLDSIAISNGFANRFLFFCSRRARRLPFGGSLTDAQLSPIAKRLRSALEFARNVRTIQWGSDAKEDWESFYRCWPEAQGLLGTITVRAEPQVMRIAMHYALLDGKSVIGREHLHAAFALWAYAYASARVVFGSRLGDTVADKILEGVRKSPNGLDREAIGALFARHVTAQRVADSIEKLRSRGLVRTEEIATGGRPREVTHAILRAESAESAESLRGDPLSALFALIAQPKTMNGATHL